MKDSRMNALSGCVAAPLERSEGKYLRNHFKCPDALVAGSLGQALWTGIGLNRTLHTQFPGSSHSSIPMFYRVPGSSDLRGAIPRPPAVCWAPCLEPFLCYLISSSTHRTWDFCFSMAGLAPLLQDAGGGAGVLPAHQVCSLGSSLGLHPPEASP